MNPRKRLYKSLDNVTSLPRPFPKQFHAMRIFFGVGILAAMENRLVTRLFTIIHGFALVAYDLGVRIARVL